MKTDKSTDRIKILRDRSNDRIKRDNDKVNLKNLRKFDV